MKPYYEHAGMIRWYNGRHEFMSVRLWCPSGWSQQARSSEAVRERSQPSTSEAHSQASEGHCGRATASLEHETATLTYRNTTCRSFRLRRREDGCRERRVEARTSDRGRANAWSCTQSVRGRASHQRGPGGQRREQFVCLPKCQSPQRRASLGVLRPAIAPSTRADCVFGWAI